MQKDPLIGQKFGDYTILELLHTGRTSKIYIAEDPKLERRAVVKVLDPSLYRRDESDIQRFVKEAKSVARLDHENVVPFYQYGEKDGMIFIAMKFIQGLNLADEIRRQENSAQPMPLRSAFLGLKQIASALDFAHGHGITHRDVKPANILVGKNHRFYLIDFGLALRTIDVTHDTDTAFGTPRYISPEQILDNTQIIPQSDIYSLGVIIYEMLTGYMLFDGSKPLDIIMGHLYKEPILPSQLNPRIPKSAERELLKVLQKEPQKRHTTAGEFIKNLELAYGNLLDDYTDYTLTISLPIKSPPINQSQMVNKPENYIPKPKQHTQFRIFVSYRRTDRKIVESFVNLLGEMDHIVWYDQHLSGGQRWWDAILAEIRDCDLFIPVISPEYLKSYPCKLEYEYADNLKKRILPVEAIPIKDYRLLPTPLQHYQVVKAYQMNKVFLAELEKAFLGLKPVSPMPDPLPKPPDVPIPELSRLRDRAESQLLGNLDEQYLLINKLEAYMKVNHSEDAEFAYQILVFIQQRQDVFKPVSDKIANLLSEYNKNKRRRKFW